MDLRQLRYFVTVADELNFSRAAEKLHMSQPPLSHQIKALEDELGVELLYRTRREVKLTDAGRVLLKHARSLFDQVDVAVKSTVNAAAGDSGVLRLGMATSAVFNVMPKVLDAIRTRLPSVEVIVADMESKEQIRHVALDKLDIGFIHATPQTSGMQHVEMFSEPYAAVLPAGHRLLELEPLTLKDLANVPMVAFSREHAPALSDALIATCLSAGFHPNIAHTARHPLTVLQMVSVGLGVALVPKSFTPTAFGGVRFRDLEGDSGHIRIEAIWLDNHPSELVQRVIAEVILPASRLTAPRG